MTTPNITIVVVGEKDVGKSSILASIFENRDLLRKKITKQPIHSKGWAVTPIDLPGTNNSSAIADAVGYDTNEGEISDFIQNEIDGLGKKQKVDEFGLKEWENEKDVWDKITKSDLCLYVVDIAQKVDSRRKVDRRRKNVRAHFQLINGAKVPILTLLNRTKDDSVYRQEWLEVLKTVGEYYPIDCDAWVHTRDDAVRVFEAIEQKLCFFKAEAEGREKMKSLRKEIKNQKGKADLYKEVICVAIAQFIANVKINLFSKQVSRQEADENSAFNDLLVLAKYWHDEYLNKFTEVLAKCCGNFKDESPPVDLKDKLDYGMQHFAQDAVPFAGEYLIYWIDQHITLHPKDELLIRFAERLLEFGVKVYRRGHATEPKLPILGKQALKDKKIKKQIAAAIIKYSNAEREKDWGLPKDDVKNASRYQKWAKLKLKNARQVLLTDIRATFDQYLEQNTPKVYSETD
jgi:GTPase SAR1 family protein